MQLLILKNRHWLSRPSPLPRANGAERRSGRKPGARVLFPSEGTITIYTRGNESISEV
jgi:hypothetical protein